MKEGDVITWEQVVALIEKTAIFFTEIGLESINGKIEMFIAFSGYKFIQIDKKKWKAIKVPVSLVKE